MSSTRAPERDASGVKRTARGLVDRVSAFRSRVRSTRTGFLVWRILATVAGVGIIVLGVILLPLPGPGWLIIFAGLGVLATEFEWASRLLRFARRQVAAWTEWVKRQSRPVQALVGMMGLAVIVAALLLAWWIYRR